MSKLNICNTGTKGRSVLSAEVVPLDKERINQIKSNQTYSVVVDAVTISLVVEDPVTISLVVEDPVTI